MPTPSPRGHRRLTHEADPLKRCKSARPPIARHLGHHHNVVRRVLGRKELRAPSLSQRPSIVGPYLHSSATRSPIYPMLTSNHAAGSRATPARERGCARSSRRCAQNSGPRPTCAFAHCLETRPRTTGADFGDPEERPRRAAADGLLRRPELVAAARRALHASTSGRRCPSSSRAMCLYSDASAACRASCCPTTSRARCSSGGATIRDNATPINLANPTASPPGPACRERRVWNGGSGFHRRLAHDGDPLKREAGSAGGIHTPMTPQLKYRRN